jgi:hypothetical protein
VSINIRPDPIITAGNAMTELSQVVSSAITSDLEPNQAAAAGHHGWESAAAVMQVAGAWENRLANLAFQLGQLGDRLRTSAASYSQAGAEAARRIQEVFTLLESPPGSS